MILSKFAFLAAVFLAAECGGGSENVDGRDFSQPPRRATDGRACLMQFRIRLRPFVTPALLAAQSFRLLQSHRRGVLAQPPSTSSRS